MMDKSQHTNAKKTTCFEHFSGGGNMIDMFIHKQGWAMDHYFVEPKQRLVRKYLQYDRIL